MSESAAVSDRGLHRSLELRCGLELPERIGLAPMTNIQSNLDGTLHEDEYRWLVRRARDGFRVVSTCAAFVSEEGKAWAGQLGVASDAHDAGLRRLAAGLRDNGAVSILQLHHGGAKAELAPGQPLSTADGGPANSRGATQADIDRVIADFVAAATRAERAGFDGVEIHGANGYLFTQFLAPEDNPRTDGYGGDLAGRARLLRETMCAVRAAVSPGFAVGVRLSPVDVWAKRGLVLDDGVEVARWMAEDGADFVHLSLGDAGGAPAHEPDRGPVARAVREALPAEVPIFAAGGVWTREDAARAIDAGVDVVVVGRAAIAHPEWPRVFEGPEWEPVRPTWSRDLLRSKDVSERLLGYLGNFSGMVEGGAPKRS